MDIKKATTIASVTVMTFMLAGGFFIKVRCDDPNPMPDNDIESVSSELASTLDEKQHGGNKR
jgi:hypothetical protein